MLVQQGGPLLRGRVRRMTIVAYKKGVLAADSCISDGTLDCGIMRKIVRSKSGLLAGASGDAQDIVVFLQWCARDMRGKRPEFGKDALAGIIVKPDGTIWYCEAGGVPYRLTSDFYAAGDGAHMAIGAMAAGADPVRAVKIVCRFNTTCREPVQALRLDGRPHELDPADLNLE